MKKSLVFVAAFMGGVMNAHGVTSPSSVNFKVFEMRISKNANCSGAISVFSTASPTAMNLFSSPNFGSGVISTGTYHCVMFHISDIVSFTPQDSLEAPGCVAGTPYTFDHFQTGNGQPNSIDPSGAPIAPSAGTVEDGPWIYFSDAATAATTQTVGFNLNCVQPTPGTSNACAMPAFVVFSDQARSLVLDFDNQIVQSGGTCATQTPVLSIR